MPDTRNDHYLERPLPSSNDTERVIIGSVIMDNGLMAECIESLPPEAFYNPLNRRIYTAMVTLFNSSHTIDPITIGEILRAEGTLDSIGGVAVITNYTHGIPRTPALTEYIQILLNKLSAREIVRVSTANLQLALSEEVTGDLLIDQCEERIFALRQGQERTEFSSSHTLANESFERVLLIGSTGQRVIGLPTGFVDLDERTLGLHRSELSILASRPSMGKTALALNISQNAAYRANSAVAFFSLEMSKSQIVERIICSECQIDSHRYRTGMLNEEDVGLITAFRDSIVESRLYVDDTPAITISYLRAKLRRLLHQLRELDLVVIDYLQLMTGNADSREREIAQISRDLKTIAKEFEVPVLATAQLNRSPELRANHRPTMGDLRESGQIEQDADAVMGLYRSDYYCQDPAAFTNIGEVIILKQRNGPTGTVNLQYTPETTTFRNLARGDF